jgi:PRTRC genetic system ThiF family protein
MKHVINPELLDRQVHVVLVGAGGNGSRMLERLVSLHRAMIARGHPYGLHVTVVDPDTVSESNIGRQAFYPSDVGLPKAVVLAHRVNMSLEGVVWDAKVCLVGALKDVHRVDIVIGAVDNRAARKQILAQFKPGYGRARYWLDLGNRKDDGQVVLGQIDNGKEPPGPQRLPHIAELYPEMVDPSTEGSDDTPSCSLADALEKQSLFINPTVADFAANLLFRLFTYGELEAHGVFVNLKRSMVTPLRVDPEAWKRFGIEQPKPKRQKSAKKTQAVAA